MTLVADAFIVDTCVFVRWFLQQDPGYEHARAIRSSFLAGDVILQTVDCARFELSNVLRRQGLLKGLLSVEEYVAASRSVDDLGVTIHVTDAAALERSAELAARFTLTFFDAVFIDRAIEAGVPLLTTDRHLANAVGNAVSIEVLRGVA